MILLQENACPHIAALTLQKLEQFDWNTLEPPPESPGLSSHSDFHIFSSFKEAPGGRRFNSDAELDIRGRDVKVAYSLLKAREYVEK